MFYQIFIFLAIFNSAFNLLPNPEKTLPKTNNIIFKTSDGGTTWDDVSAGLPQKFDAWSIFASKEEVLLGHEKGIFSASTFSSTPQWQKEIYLKESVSVIIPGQSGPYAGSYNERFFQKMSGTGVWIPVYTSLHGKTVRTIFEAKNGHVFVGCENGILKSTDKGKTWQMVFEDGMVTSFLEKDNVLLAGSSKGIIRSIDDGKLWVPVLTEDGPTYSIKIIDDQLIAISFGTRSQKDIDENTNTESNTIRRSDDKGKTWKTTYKNLSPFHYMYKMEDKQSPIRIINDIEATDKYIFCSIEKGVFRSDDHGKSWELVLPCGENTLFDLAVSGNVVYAVKVFRGC